jgi:hypothetical protein
MKITETGFAKQLKGHSAPEMLAAIQIRNSLSCFLYLIKETKA